MQRIFSIQQLVAVTALGVALAMSSGCESDRETATVSPNAPTIEPKLSPPKSAVEELKNDFKPPVVVTPGAAGGTITPAPRHD